MYDTRFYVDPKGRTTLVLKAETRKKNNIKNLDGATVDDSQKGKIVIYLKKEDAMQVETPLFYKGEVIGTATVNVENGTANAVEVTEETVRKMREENDRS